ncbi:hypothetical protein GPALN_011123 [Globodera pallida]|nr:hypothetical protein GPALN_011123 [Globodera pallida]
MFFPMGPSEDQGMQQQAQALASRKARDDFFTFVAYGVVLLKAIMEPTDDHQLNNFMQQIQAEAQKQGLQEQMLSLNSRCFDICFTDSRPPSKMDGKSQTCLANCVNRIFDAKQFMFEHLQKSSPAGAI